MNILCRPVSRISLGILISCFLLAPIVQGQNTGHDSARAGDPAYSGRPGPAGTPSAFAIQHDMYSNTSAERHATRLSEEERRVLRRQVNDAARNIYPRRR